MANGNGKVVINLSTGLEDPERVTVAFLVGGAAVEQGKSVAMFLTKEAVRLALPGVAEGRRLRGLPSARAPLPAVHRGRRRAPHVPDLLQRAQARRRRARGEREAGRCHAALGMDRRGSDGVQLLAGHRAEPRQIARMRIAGARARPRGHERRMRSEAALLS